VTGILSLVGMRFLADQLQALATEDRRRVEMVRLRGLCEQVQRAADHRRESVFAGDPWLRIEGREADGFTLLEGLWIRTMDERGRPETRSWKRMDGEWVEIHQSGDGPLEPPRIRGSGYAGEIRIWPGPGEYGLGSAIDRIRVAFPAARTLSLREGFTIFTYW
jgi:hypothetical protein